MKGFGSMTDMVLLAEETGKTIADIVIMTEIETSGRTAEAVFDDMALRLQIMKEAAAKGICGKDKSSLGGLADGDACRISRGARLVGHTVGLAMTYALKNMLGLVCDPVAGLVELPCVKRNGFSALHALVAAEMALAGVESVIPADEVIEAMFRIGQDLPRSLKETAEGGLAQTPTGIKIARDMTAKR